METVLNQTLNYLLAFAIFIFLIIFLVFAITFIYQNKPKVIISWNAKMKDFMKILISTYGKENIKVSGDSYVNLKDWNKNLGRIDKISLFEMDIIIRIEPLADRNNRTGPRSNPSIKIYLDNKSLFKDGKRIRRKAKKILKLKEKPRITIL